MSLESSFRCKICEAEVDSLYSVRLSPLRMNEPSEEEMKRLNSLPDNEARLYVEADRNQYGIKRSFICKSCLDKFANAEIQIADFHGTPWRLAAPDWYKLKSGKYPAVYDYRKWQRFQMRTLQRMTQHAP